MEEQLISFETAKLLSNTNFNRKNCSNGYIIETKELSFDYTLDYLNKKAIAAPSQSLLQKWLREVHKINVESNYLPNIQKYGCLYIPMNHIALVNDYSYISRLKFETYEEALEQGLQQALKLIQL